MTKEEIAALAAEKASKKAAATYRTAREQRTLQISVTTVAPFEFMKDGVKQTPDSTKVTGNVMKDGKPELVSVVIPNKGMGKLPKSFAVAQDATFTEEWDETRERWYARGIEFVNAEKINVIIDDLAIAKALLK